MKTTLLASAILVALTSVAVAAPVASPKASVVAPNINIDPAAVALLDQSVAAYEQFDSLALVFTVDHVRDGKAQPERASRGSLIIRNPDRARLEWNFDETKTVYIANESLMNVQREPTTYYETRDEEEDFVYTIISLLNEPLGDLMTGDNTLAPESGFGWKSVAVVSNKEFDCVALRQKFAPTTYRIYFDKATHLVRRIETEREYIRLIGDKPVPDLATLTLTSIKAKIAPTTFDYVPPAGAKRTTQADMPKFYDERLVVGAEPFALVGKTLEGKPLSLDDYQGKVVLLDFWATWCEPCMTELPTLEANYNKYRAQGFDIISIAKADNEATVRAFVKEHGIAWTQVDDGEQMPNVKTYGARGIPFAILIGKDGKIAAINLRGEELEPAIVKALAQ